MNPAPLEKSGSTTCMLATATHPSPELDAALARLRERGEADFSRAEPIVREILDAVRKSGDEAVLLYCARFEKRRPRELARRLDSGVGEAALAALPRDARDALEIAATRIARFHE